MPDVGQVNDPVVAPLTVAVGDDLGDHIAPVDLLQFGFLGIPGDLGGDSAILFQKPEDERFRVRAPATFVSNPAGGAK